MPELTAPNPAITTRSTRINRIPLSTYRLQLGAELDLRQVRHLLPYLERLGVSDLYLSPLFRSRAESSHGYDVVDHGTIDPAIGDLTSFEDLANGTREAGMGILLDVVPNHMGINDSGNLWWLDVLENGEGAYFAPYFDIDWRPAASALHDKVLLPFLGDSFGTVLERCELQVVYANERLQLQYFDRRFPLAPTTWPQILELAAARQSDDTIADRGQLADWLELQSIITQLRNLPPRHRRDAASMEERYREQTIVRQRLAALLSASPTVKAALHEAINEFNGENGNPRSFDLLEHLLEDQSYRLAYWRVAVDEINYRRFFDVNDLAAIRVEDPRVFDATHRLIGKLVGAGWVTGLRIDHPDGLRDPQNYFKKLHGLYRAEHANHNGADHIYVVAEKILSGDEPLPVDWEVSGTTGYDMMNVLNRLLVDGDGLAELRGFYDEVTGNTARPLDVIYESKRTVLFSTMASELQLLAARLYRIAQGHRASRDITRPMLQRAIREIIACMAVYRTYNRMDSWDVEDADYRVISTAVRLAKLRNRSLPSSVFDYVASVLLLEHPPTITDEQAAERREFTLKFQQVSGPVTAKGVEDTAFYRYYPLASLNEVGGELDAKPLAVDEFHRHMRHRMELWPHSMTGTSTHDTKRGEDFRARLDVLSEVPVEWKRVFQRWCEMNEPLRRDADGERAPDINEQYLLYQTLVGTWPVKPPDARERATYKDRIVQYMGKALNEAKIHTSWMNPSETYERAVRGFIEDAFEERGAAFRAEVDELARKISDAGFVNSLAQLVLKMTAPGVPDFYQGTELWDFNLVDPDNRRPVDFPLRQRQLNEILDADDVDSEEFADSISQRWPDAVVKLWVTTRSLSLRRQWGDVFNFGEYIPLTVEGGAADHVVAYARRHEDKCVVAVVPRNVCRLCEGDVAAWFTKGQSSVISRIWHGTRLTLPPDCGQLWNCRVSNHTYTIGDLDEPSIDVGKLFQSFPVALLTCDTR
jgi:(1->4)-alpha-D-glucan 1-alpha-D-glucosylmutase